MKAKSRRRLASGCHEQVAEVGDQHAAHVVIVVLVIVVVVVGAVEIEVVLRIAPGSWFPCPEAESRPQNMATSEAPIRDSAIGPIMTPPPLASCFQFVFFVNSTSRPPLPSRLELGWGGVCGNFASLQKGPLECVCLLSRQPHLASLRSGSDRTSASCHISRRSSRIREIVPVRPLVTGTIINNNRPIVLPRASIVKLLVWLCDGQTKRMSLLLLVCRAPHRCQKDSQVDYNDSVPSVEVATWKLRQ